MDVKIEEDRIKQTASVQSSKYLSKFLVSKLSTSSTFFKIELENGPTPSQLSGAYSNIAKANEAILEFLLKAKETQAAKNERLDKERKKRNAVTNSKGS